MKNEHSWRPTKFTRNKSGKWRGNRNGTDLSPASVMIADKVASLYQENIIKYAKGKLLDLGCGNAPLYGIYKDFIDDITCIDWENSPNKQSYVDIYCDISKEIPLESNMFDTIIISDVLEHIPTPSLVWQEIARILRPGGVVLLNVPYMYIIHEKPYDFYRYSEFAFKKNISDCNLLLLNIETVGGSAEVIADMFAKHFVQVPYVGKYFACAVQLCAMAISSTSIGKRFSIKTAKSYPLGYFVVATKKEKMSFE